MSDSCDSAQAFALFIYEHARDVFMQIYTVFPHLDWYRVEIFAWAMAIFFAACGIRAVGAIRTVRRQRAKKQGDRP
jgi:hypothetical protein